jgi:hypothetical protein
MTLAHLQLLAESPVILFERYAHLSPWHRKVWAEFGKGAVETSNGKFESETGTVTGVRWGRNGQPEIAEVSVLFGLMRAASVVSV